MNPYFAILSTYNLQTLGSQMAYNLSATLTMHRHSPTFSMILEMSDNNFDSMDSPPGSHKKWGL